VKRFADQHGLRRIALDQWAIYDPVATVPQAELWDCQKPTAADDGRWVMVSANMIMDGRNRTWLMQYPHQALAGGSMYAVQLPEHIPAAGNSDSKLRASHSRRLQPSRATSDLCRSYRFASLILSQRGVMVLGRLSMLLYVKEASNATIATDRQCNGEMWVCLSK
jgi:hypothetical protein